eukprot:918719-Heterocapsa_arctica.AAC.1
MRAVPQCLLTPEDKARAKCLRRVPRALPCPPSSVAQAKNGGVQSIELETKWLRKTIIFVPRIRSGEWFRADTKHPAP